MRKLDGTALRVGAGIERVAAAAVICLLTLLASAPAAARHDIGAGRMGYTDWSSVSGFQSRIWAVDLDGQLVSKRVDVNEGGWWTRKLGRGAKLGVLNSTSGSA
jgi:hypothetical protein